MEHITPEKIAELKKQYGAIYQVDISWKEKSNKVHKVTITHRAPTAMDMDRMAQTMQRSSIAAVEELFTSIVLHPSPVDILPSLRQSPKVLLQFANEYLDSFLVQDVEIQNTRTL